MATVLRCKASRYQSSSAVCSLSPSYPLSRPIPHTPFLPHSSSTFLSLSFSPSPSASFLFLSLRCPAYATAKNIVIVNETVLVSAHLLERCTALFQPLMESKAKALPASALLELQGGSTTASATGGGQDSSERSSSKGAK